MQDKVSIASSRTYVRAICAIILLGCGSLAQAADASYDDSRGAYLKHPDRPIWIGGDYLRAMQVAYEDFVKILAKQNQRAAGLFKQGDGQRAEDEKWLGEIENYDVRVEVTTDHYTVRFSPTLRDQENRVVFGGGASYTISRGSFKILSKQRFK